MTAQGIMSGAGSAMGAMFSGFPAVGGSVKGAQESSFEQFMETSKNEIEQNPVDSTQNKSVKDTGVKQTDVKERAKEMFSDTGKVREVKEMPAEESLEISEETTEAVSTLLVQVRQMICETLDITEEELTKTMDALGLQETDLLDRDSLQQIFLSLNDADPTAFLTNEELFTEFTELLQDVMQTVEVSGVTVEEVKAVAENMKEIEVPVENEETVTFEEAVEGKETKEQEDGTEAKVQEDTVETTNYEISSETKAETGNTKEEGHMTEARKDGEKVVISSETDVNVKNVFIDALANYAVNESGELNPEVAAQVREIANQIMEQIKITIRPEQTNMELQLNPEHLGRVHLTITEKEGMMTAQFTTQTEIAKEAIESQMTALKESLQNQGIKVEAIEVTVSEFGFERDRSSEQNENGEPEKRRKSETFQVEDVEEGIPQMAEYLNVTDSSVDYSA